MITITTVPLPVLVSSSTPQSACEGASATFAISATGAGLTYQWQEDAGSGFADISNGGVYSGALSNTLQISNATGKNGFLYRCIVSSGTVCSVTSTPSALTVNALPVVVNQTPAAVCEAVAGSGTSTYDLTTLNASISAGQTNRAVGWFTNAGAQCAGC
ncbi:MAG: immunoglobulin domain-containing protein [Bacteroidia bacterium]|nr:immunoglobulin domain-containing protein [Bacteroidia bacterium]